MKTSYKITVNRYKTRRVAFEVLEALNALELGKSLNWMQGKQGETINHINSYKLI